MGEERPNPQRLAIPAIASTGAAIMHATAAGVRADDIGLSRLLLALALAQATAAIVGLIRADRVAVHSLLWVNVAAAAGWLVTRLVGIPFIGGLEIAVRPTMADTVAAVFALAAATGAAATMFHRPVTLPSTAISSTALLVGALLIPGLADATARDHGDDLGAAATARDHEGLDSAAVAAEPLLVPDSDVSAAGEHDHDAHDHDAADEHDPEPAVVDDSEHDDADHTASLVESGTWPRPWDPTAPIDFSGVPGVSAQQQAQAEALVADTLRELPHFADVTSLVGSGYRSIGDAATGFEHYISTDLIVDDALLDPAAPESLVYRVDGDDRTLVSAMFIANDTPIDDPALTEFAGPLMQWHVHGNLCWGPDDDGRPVVRSLTDANGKCAPGTVNAGGENPMVHVWITPHECGPFAALEGHGSGQASVSDGARMDLCHDGDHDGGNDPAAAETTRYDPELPIDLGGVDGVTPRQQAFAENLVAATVRDLPQWQDLDAVEAAGFESIGDGDSGHEHYINWDWIDDDTILDPDRPESLVFEPKPDGTKQLVSAMYMLPSDTSLDEVPDFGGALMQWHVHSDLCFTDDPVAPQVADVKPIGTACRPPFVDGTMAPMIHVWITPHECGPFAALDGIGGGQVPEGEAVLCDTAHGSH